MIYHIAHRDDWEPNKDSVTFIPVDYHKEGFIHCCTESQLDGVITRYFEGAINLVLLHIDESKLTSELKYETSTNSEQFPHIYGPINCEAIVGVTYR